MKTLTLLLLLAGAAQAAVVSEYYKPPKSFPPTTEVEVFRTQRPTRPYVELAELQSRKRNGATEDLVKTAKQIGADAIIMLDSKTVGHVAVSTVFVPVKRSVAIAIRYTDKEESK